MVDSYGILALRLCKCAIMLLALLRMVVLALSRLRNGLTFTAVYMQKIILLLNKIFVNVLRTNL